LEPDEKANVGTMVRRTGVSKKCGRCHFIGHRLTCKETTIATQTPASSQPTAITQTPTSPQPIVASQPGGS